MWGGGMPDDITIVALRVINKSQSSADVSYVFYRLLAVLMVYAL